MGKECVTTWAKIVPARGLSALFGIYTLTVLTSNFNSTLKEGFQDSAHMHKSFFFSLLHDVASSAGKLI